MIFRKLFKECEIEGLPLWQCPSFLFFIMGVLTILIMGITYFFARFYLTIEVLFFSEALIAVIMLVIGYLIGQGIGRITQARKLAEIEKKKTEAIIRHLTDGLIILSKDYNVILVNPKAEQLLGIKEDEVLGKKPKIEISQDKSESFYKTIKTFGTKEKIEKLLQKGTIKEEITISEPVPKILQIWRTKIEDKSGKVLGFLNVLHDVTIEKEVDRMKSEFISIASHQLYTPLSSLKWLIELLKKERVGKLVPEQKNLLEKIYGVNEQMIKMVQDLLNVSRIEGGRARLKLKEENIEKIIKEAISELKLKAQKKRIELDYIPCPQKISIFRFDPEKIKLALSNIIDNAIQYTGEKGKVTVEILRKPQEVEIRIKDAGVGIPQKEQFKVFTKFYRGSNVRKLKVKGTGLGLYIARNIIETHRGKIWFSSQEGKGTTFYITLPIKNI